MTNVLYFQVLHVVAKFLDEGPPSNSVKCRKNLQRTLHNGTRNQPASYMEYEVNVYICLCNIYVFFYGPSDIKQPKKIEVKKKENIF